MPENQPPTQPPPYPNVATTPPVTVPPQPPPGDPNLAQQLAAQPDVRLDELQEPELIIYSHSSLFYWWPIWVIGYLMALVTYWEGVLHQVVRPEPAGQQAAAEGPTKDIHRNLDGDTVLIHRNSNLGVIFLLTLFLTILITNVTMRGQASVIVILCVVLTTELLAYFNLWDAVLNWFGGLKVYLNLGAYFWFSTLMFLVWLFTTFVFDRMSYWRIRPGQVTQEFVLGAAARSYDTENMVLEKFRDDFFRHWVLGFGSGDLHIKPYGADREQISIPNVLFIGSKVSTIQHMIAIKPEEFGHPVLK